MGKGGGKSTTTVEPQPSQIPPELAPWVSQAVQNIIGAMPYTPLPLFAQPNPQQIPDLNPQQYSLINAVLGQAYNPAVYQPGNDAMNLTRAALGMGPAQPILPQGSAPSPFQPLPPQSSIPVLPQWNQPPPQMGWLPGPNGPTWGVVNPTPGYVAPPPTTPGQNGPGVPGQPGLPFIDPFTGRPTSDRPETIVSTGNNPG